MTVAEYIMTFKSISERTFLYDLLVNNGGWQLDEKFNDEEFDNNDSLCK